MSWFASFLSIRSILFFIVNTFFLQMWIMFNLMWNIFVCLLNYLIFKMLFFFNEIYFFLWSKFCRCSVTTSSAVFGRRGRQPSGPRRLDEWQLQWQWQWKWQGQGQWRWQLAKFSQMTWKWVEEPDFLLIMTMKMTTTLSSHQLVPTKPCNFQKNQSMEYHSTLETSFNN